MIPPTPQGSNPRPIDRGRAQLVERLFFEAADLRGQARRRFLDEHCAGDPTLRREVEVLLSVDEGGTGGLLGQTPVDPADLPRAVSASVHDAESLPKWIGAYKATRRLGEGGFGLVYFAEQSTPIRRQVALKVIRPGMGSPQVIERFMAERQALALMDHPGVAKVFDAGTTDDGRPYFAMEFVDGVPITEFARARALPIPARLELFTQVCDAVQHAHQKGVIHRDLKPTNILVEAPSPGESSTSPGHPKVIDFGIAKALAEPLTGNSLHTLSGQIIGTPEYMSPEQAASAGDVDTRGDVYSLGVVLYELLTGLLPFDSLRLRSSSLADLQRVIREQEAIRPSQRLSRAADEEESAPDPGLVSDSSRSDAPRRASTVLGLDPRQTSRRLRGELDWITTKAIEKDRDRRYASAAEFAADIRRHLNGEPVLASPPSATYRLSKWARRHKVLLAAGSAVSLAVIAGLAGTIWGLREAVEGQRRARDAELVARIEAQNARDAQGRADAQALRAEAEAANARQAQALADAEAQRARTEAVTARRVSDFLEQMLRGVGPVVAQGADTVILRQILDRAASEIGQALGQEPLAEARLRHAIGAAYHEIEDLPDAITHLERAVTLLESLPEASLDELTAARYSLGMTYHAQGMLDEARTLLDLVYSDELGPLDKPRSAAATLADLALIAYDQNDFSGAQVYAQRAMGALVELDLGESDEACLLRNTLAMIANERSEYQHAIDLYTESLEISERLRGPNHPTTLTTRANLASQYMNLRDFEHAAAVLVTCVQDMRRVYGPGHSETITTMSNYGTALLNLGRLDEAAPLYTEAERQAAENLGESHWITQYTRGNLARLHIARGEHDEAASLYELIVQTMEPQNGPGDVDVRRFRNRMTESLRRAGRLDEALVSAVASINAGESVGAVDGTQATALRDAAMSCLDAEKVEDAVAWIDRLRAMASSLESPVQRNMLAWVADLHGRALVRLGRAEEAAAELELSYDLWVEGYGTQDSDARRLAAALAEVLESQGQHDAAAAWRTKADPQAIPPAP